MESQNTHDFDQFWSEAEDKRVPFKIFGKEEFLPSSLPAKMLLKVIRTQKETKGAIPDEVLSEIAISIFGEDKIEEWAEKGLTMDQLSDMMDWAISVYKGDSKKNTKKKK